MTGAVRGNLPHDVSTFVGRRQEIERASKLLSHVRLLTLTGPGGVGKTRLAVQIAAQVQLSLHDGAWIVDLGALHATAGDSPDRFYAHIALALGIRHHGTAGLDVLLDHLRTRRALLVVDNCEHLIPATKTWVDTLLRAAPHVRVLATSRQPLGVDGEHTFVVPPLPIADAVELFLVGASAAGADVALPSAPADVDELCRRLDGLPLAVRLAAGRARTLSVRQLLDRLDDRFRLLTDTSTVLADANHLGRHSTLEGVVDWSYELCTPAEQLLWARAAVFERAFDLAAIEAVCAGDDADPADIVDLVTSLVDKSVLSVDESRTALGGAPRYYLLNSLREYGLRRLDTSAETHRMRAVHRDYYRDLVAKAATTWLGPDELAVMARVHQELGNVLAAIDESITRHDLPSARAICRNLVRLRAPFFWGSLDIVAQQLRRVADIHHAKSVTNVEEAADLSSTIAVAAWVAVTQGRYDAARALLESAHEVADQWALPAPPPVLFAEGGTQALGAGSPRAIDLLATARAAFATPDTVGDQHMATMMWAIGSAFADDPSAVAAASEHLSQAEAAQAPWAVSWALWASALAALCSGNHAQATEFIGRSLRLQQDMDDQWGQTWSIELCTWIIAAGLDQADDPRSEAERAAWLLGAALARQLKLGVKLSGLRPLAQGHAVALTQIGAYLDEVTIAETMSAGSRNNTQAVRVAVGKRTSRQPSPQRADSLTEREREIASLIAQDKTSAEIAVQLRIARRTVDTHVRNVMRKLGVHRRAGIATWVATTRSKPSARE